MRTFIFDYVYKNAEYSFEIEADTEEEAIERAQAMRGHYYVGESMLKITMPMLKEPQVAWWKSLFKFFMR